MTSPTKSTVAGIDVLLQEETAWKGKRLALVTNDAALTSTGELTRGALLKSGYNLVLLFSPEHGLGAMSADGTFQPDSLDTVTGLNVISLYGDHLAPTHQDLQDIDVVLFDIPDVGCRFYTYLWTMTYVMESCARFDKQFVVLDRPNPIGGNLDDAEGPMLDELRCASFIGRWSIPIRHACTLGELALYFAATRIPSFQPIVVKAKGWNRNNIVSPDEFFNPTSPAIQTLETALFYPGMGLLEGINVDEGRGTGKAFRVCGAPWINKKELNSCFAQKNCKGVTASSVTYLAMVGQYAGTLCNGLEFQLTPGAGFRPVSTGIELMSCIMQLFPGNIKERRYPTRANPTGEAHLDKLLGIPDSFQKIKQGIMIDTSVPSWPGMVKPYTLY